MLKLNKLENKAMTNAPPTPAKASAKKVVVPAPATKAAAAARAARRALASERCPSRGN